MALLVVGFDLDMTLIDSRPGVVATFDALNDELGTAIDGAAIASRLGPPLEREMAAYFPPEEIDPVCDRFRALYAQHGIRGCHALPGAAAAVEHVRTIGATTLVVTAKYEPNAHRCLDHVGISVDHVVGWRHGPQKAETLRDHGAHVYVGDTVPDVEAALAAGARAIAVTSGPVGRAELQAAGAHVVLDSLAEFPEWLASDSLAAD
ncbi:MAG: HAD hydrolase-like protein [Acidimicrobiia bacterium]|nr:HAD hydrolase-like protein [Acidimicrobiia bacterium]